MDSGDLCIDHCIGDLGTFQRLPQLALTRLKLPIRILLVDVQTQRGADITNGVLTIRHECR